MCRSLRVLCAASDPARLEELRRAVVGTQWELVGGAASIRDLRQQVEEWRPDVVVMDHPLGSKGLAAIRRASSSARIVAVGAVPGADAEASNLEDVRPAIRGLPRRGGPVRT
jgi:AmiR/NasT family two-component response regulator